MRVVISSTPEQSHLAPQMPLALELQRRCHEVLVACGARVGQYSRQIGIRTVAAGLDLDPDRLGAGLNVSPPPDLPPSSLARWATRVVFVETFAAALVGELRRIAEEWRPAVLMRDVREYAWVMGEVLGIPVITLTFGRLPQPDDEQDSAGDALQELRRAQGLEPDPELSTLYAGPVLVPARNSYVDPEIPVLSTVSFVQPMLLDTVGADGLPPWVADLGSYPVVHATLGNIIKAQRSQ